MAREATIRNDRRCETWKATADHEPGQVVQTPSGAAGVILGSNKELLKTGFEVTADTECVADVASASATVFAAGDAVQWDDTGNLAVASGDFAIGKANKAKANGETVVRVAFNR